MLTKVDKKTIKDIVAGSLREFFETLILPYFDHNEKDHDEMKKILRKHDERFDSYDERFNSYDERFNSIDKELDSIQRKLEKNDDDHEETFQRLDRIERSATNYDKRIKKMESIISP